MTAHTESLAPLTQEQENLFWSKVDKNGPVVREGLTPCWVWTGYVNHGYGSMMIKGKNYRTHRLSLFIIKGIDVHEGEACHKCDNRACVNPDHIEIADRKYNMDECVSRGRAKYKYSCGVFHHNAKLTDEIVASIRKESDGGVSRGKLAKKWEVSLGTIKDIVHYRTWKNDSTEGVRSSIPKK